MITLISHQQLKHALIIYMQTQCLAVQPLDTVYMYRTYTIPHLKQLGPGSGCVIRYMYGQHCPVDSHWAYSKYSLSKSTIQMAVSNTLLEILIQLLYEITMFPLFRNQFGLPFLFQTEEEGSEIQCAAVTDDSESNSSSSPVRRTEPEMKQGKFRSSLINGYQSPLLQSCVCQLLLTFFSGKTLLDHTKETM